MSGPLFSRAGTRSQSAGAASLSPALPAVDGAGGILICIVFSKNNATHACATTGWNKLGATINSGASFCASIFWAAEGVAAPTITWTGSVACAAQICYYSNPNGRVDTSALGNTSNSTGATATHTSTAVNTSRNDSLVIAVDATAANTAIATPAGWAEDVDTGSSIDGGHNSFDSKSVAVSGTSSGAISIAGANAAWVQWQIEIMQSALTAGLESSKMEVAALFEPPAGLSAAKLETGLWLTANPRSFSRHGNLPYLRQ